MVRPVHCPVLPPLPVGAAEIVQVWASLGDRFPPGEGVGVEMQEDSFAASDGCRNPGGFAAPDERSAPDGVWVDLAVLGGIDTGEAEQRLGLAEPGDGHD